MIICDYIKKINSTLSKVHKGNELVMTTDRDYLKHIPLTFRGRCVMCLGNGFTDIQFCPDYKGDGTDRWFNILSERGKTSSSSGNYYMIREAMPGYSSKDRVTISTYVSSLNHTISIRAKWIDNRSQSSTWVHDESDFRFLKKGDDYIGQGAFGYDTVFGNVNSLLAHNGWENITSLVPYGKYTFRGLFTIVDDPDTLAIPRYYAGWTNHDLENIVLPATTLSEGCYKEMFYANCHITRIPNTLLPKNVTLAPYCCQDMFALLKPMYATDDTGNREYIKEPVIIERDLIPANSVPQSNSFNGMFRNTHSTYGNFNLIKFDSGFKLPDTTNEYCYTKMFQGCNMLYTDDIPENLLPASIVANGSYSYMFENMKFLDPEDFIWGEWTQSVPKEIKLKLPATNVSGYQYMFKNSGISNVIEFPKGITINSNGLYGMYYFCSNISSANISFKTGQNFSNLGCAEMFYNCTGLTTATINLMGGNLSSRAFQTMFKGCTRLGTVNLNNVTNIDYPNCCNETFRGCTNLTTVNTDLLEWPSVNTDATTGWLNNVATGGTLKTKKNFNIPEGIDGLPSSWTHTYN